MTDAFTVDAARALGGPDWLVERRLAAAERLAIDLVADAEQEIWRYSRIGELDLDRYRPFAEAELGARRRRARAGRRPVGGGGRQARGDDRRARRARRAPRARSRRSRPRACASAASRPATTTTSRELARRGVERVRRRVHGAARRVPRGRRVRAGSRRCRGRGSDPRAALVRRRRPRVVPAHARVARRERARRRCSTASARPRPIISSTRSPSCSSATTRTCATSRCRSTARARGTSGCSARIVGRDATLRTLGGRARRRLRAAAQRGAAARARARESDQLAVYFGDGVADARLPHAPGPRRAAHAQRPAVQGRGRGRRPLGLLRSRAPADDGAEGERVADQPQPRAHRGRERGVDPEPRDRSQRREVLARLDGRPDRRRPALLPREPRHPARRRRAPDRARVLRRRVRAPAGRRAHAAGCAARSSTSSSTRGRGDDG